MGRTSFWAWLTYAELKPIIQLCRKQSISHGDLEHLDTTVDPEDLYEKFLKHYTRCKSSGWAFYYVFRRQLWTAFFAQLLALVAMLGPPLLITKILEVIPDNHSIHPAPEIRWLWVAIMFATQMTQIASQSAAEHIVFDTVLTVRCIMIKAMSTMSVIHHVHNRVYVNTVNFLSADTTSMLWISYSLMPAICGMLQVLVTMLYGYFAIGSSMLVGCGYLLLIVIPITIACSIRLKILTYKKNRCTDFRLSYVNEILQVMKVVKSNAWDDVCLRELARRRKIEFRQLILQRMLKMTTAAISTTSPIVATVVTILSLRAYSDTHTIIATDAFQTLSFFFAVQNTFLIFPAAISSAGETLVGLRRLNAFLQVEQRELQVSTSMLQHKNTSYVWPDDEADGQRGQFVLALPALSIPRGSYVAVVGAGSAGKTAFLRCMLGEMIPSFLPKESIAYCADSPFIRNQSVRQNICGAEEARDFDNTRYQDVVRRCRLLSDFELFANGDNTELGEGGSNLSGGQRFRISIARALYSRSDILLFDDLFAALDGEVATHILNNALKKDPRTRIAISMDIGVAKAADLILFFDKGVGLPLAPYDDLLASSPAFRDFAQASGASSRIDTGMETTETREVSPNKNAGKKQIQLVGQEKQTRDYIEYDVYKMYFSAGTGGSKLYFNFIVFLFLMTEFFCVCTYCWLVMWTSDYAGLGPSSSKYSHTYAILGVSVICLSGLRSLAWGTYTCRASFALHMKFARGLVESPLSFFQTTPHGRILNRASKDFFSIDTVLGDIAFYATIACIQATGAMLTVFVTLPLFVIFMPPLMFVWKHTIQDFRQAMRELQMFESASRSLLFSSFAEVVRGLSTVRAFKWEAHFLMQLQENTAKNVRSLYAFHMVERALAQKMMVIGAVLLLAVSISVCVGYQYISRGIAGLCLMSTFSVIVNLVGAVQNFFRLETLMSSVERVREYALLPPEDNSIRNLASTIGAASVDTAQRHDMLTPFKPQFGAISFINVTATYRKGLDPTLRDVSLNIAAASFVGICGRTGSGKSTLFLSLLRLIPWQGTIVIDGMDIRTIHRKELRQAITTVPQDPVLFSGTLRQNVDIFGDMSDEEIWTALEGAYFTRVVEKSEGVLDMEVSAGGANWSSGEKQMICFARAILRRNKILLLDEATSSLDATTDKLLQLSLRSVFQDVTRMVIAHRLETIADANQIIVIDAGSLAEDGGKEIIAAKMSGKPEVRRKPVQEPIDLYLRDYLTFPDDNLGDFDSYRDERENSPLLHATGVERRAKVWPPWKWKSGLERTMGNRDW